MTMTKRELVIRVANKLGMTQNDVAKIIEGTFETISHTLAEGHRWELRDFGVLEVKTRAARIGRNPRTGQQVPVLERRVVTYRPGKKMKDLVAAQAAGAPAPEAAAPRPGTTPSPAPEAGPAGPDSMGGAMLPTQSSTEGEGA